MESRKEKKNDNQKEEKKASSVNIEEVNTLSEVKEGDILFTSTMEIVHLVVLDEGVVNDWVLHNGASFHVIPCQSWFTKYDAQCRVQV